jgi:DNA-binding transcriptional LysR family regulator
MPRTDLDLNRMVVYAAVVEHRSFTVAADVLGVTTPKVSQQIAALEADLGVKLLERSKRAVAPTEAGDLYYEACTRILEEASAVTAQLIENRERPSGRLRISAPTDVIADMVVPLLPTFVRHHAAISLELQGMDEMPDFVKDRIDLAIRTHYVEPSRLNALRVGDFEQIVCAAPAYLARLPVPRGPKQLASADWVALSFLKAPRDWTFCSPAGEVISVRTRGSISVSTCAALRACLLAGLGISVAPRYLVQADLDRGALTQVLPTYVLPKGGLYIVLSSNPPPKVTAFVDLFQHHVANGRLPLVTPASARHPQLPTEDAASADNNMLAASVS